MPQVPQVRQVPQVPLGTFATLLAAAREEYAAEIRQGRGGRPALFAYTKCIDGLIREIVGNISNVPAAPYAFCAIGGYGRRTLSLHSDLDILIVFHGRIRESEERLVKALLHPLWDLHLTVGHQVCELADLDSFDEDNPEFLLALVDARLLTGDGTVFEGVCERFHRGAREQSGRVLDTLRLLVRRRHASFNDTLYQLEPDIKEAPGGLRDAVAARWFRDLAGPNWTGSARFDDARLHESEDFLLRIRSVLHSESGRNTNVLSHALQERVVDLLGYPGAATEQRVEALMGDYFRHARSIARMLEWSQAAARGPLPASEPLPLGGNLELADEGIRFVDPLRAAVDPASWVLAFRAAAEHGCRVSDHALTWIQENAGRSRPEDFVASDARRQAVRELLRPASGLYARLSEMHDCGLLGRMFPEFACIHCRVIRDFHHKYTVDEHTLLTLRNLESLLEPPGAREDGIPRHDLAGRERFAALLRELHAPELLALSLLFHDVGKWKDQEHAPESVRMVQPVLDRLQLTAEARHLVEFLIGNHLQMSRIAFRRDSEDPEVVRAFASLVGTEEQLKMLCLMTLVDIEAVSPETLTPWKEELLWRLYVDTYNRLTLAYADDLIDHDSTGRARLSQARPADVSEEELARFLDGLPKRYLALFEPERIFRHLRLARDIHRDEEHSFLEKKDEIWELTVVTLDKPYLFSNISGVLSCFGMNILRAQAMTTSAGLVLDVFEFTDAEAFLRNNSDATTHIQRLLEEAVAGHADVSRLLRAREQSVLCRHRLVAPVVYFDHEHSEKYTVVEVVADDAPGLLHRISRVISAAGCDVDLALVSTEGAKAIDVLHVTKERRKLSQSERAALKHGLEQVLIV